MEFEPEGVWTFWTVNESAENNNKIKITFTKMEWFATNSVKKVSILKKRMGKPSNNLQNYYTILHILILLEYTS